MVSIQKISLSHGRACGISVHNNSEFKSWRLRFYKEESTNPGSKFVKGHLYSRIRAILEEDYDSLVYDFEVDHVDHLFQAGTFLVHNSPWEGNRITYYRPHWYAKMLQRSKEAAIWGDSVPDPATKWWRKELTYDLEREFYQERPYPITSLPFEDIPFIGPILANTVGRLIKPPMLMHTEEWLTADGEQLAMAPGFGERRALELGELTPSRAASPFNLTGTTGEQIYRMTEMVGLPGFTATAIKESLTGSADFFDQTRRLESARRAFGIERDYWDLEIGGGLGTSEALRRLYPHRRRQIPLYNPIRNMMPEWLPGPGEKSPDFLHGDPYVKVQEGEMRLPGRGYAARFPELKNFEPDEYPAIHKYKILADVAPYSDKYKLALQRVRAQRKLDSWSEYEEEIYQTTAEQVAQKKIKRRFAEYQFLSPMGDISDDSQYYKDESKGVLAKLNQIKASQKPEQGTFAKFFGGYWEMLAHNAETSLDVLTPISPAAKLIHQRTAIEDYENSQIYGTENGFWSHPMRDFIKPFLTKASESVGFDAIPEHIKSRRRLEEYFDILEYTKNARLSNLARMSRDTQAVKKFESKKNETLFGLNPFTYNFSHIFRSLPRRDRDYFNSFVAADTVEERAKILEIVPDNEKGLYVARWKLQFKNDIDVAQKAGLLSEDQIEEADLMLDQISNEAQAEGFPNNKELFAEYVSTKLPGENYGDWYRRTKLLAEVPLPADNWVGWHPSVDLDDVKLKLVQNMGCLLPSTMIHSDCIDTTMIQDIQAGDFIMGEEGKQIKVLNTKKTRYCGDVLNIHLTGSPFDDIQITPNHMLPYQLRNHKTKYGCAGDLRKWYRLAFPSIHFNETTQVLKLTQSSRDRYNWPTEIKLTSDLAYVMGWWLAEGGTNTVNEKLKQITFSLNLEKEEHIAIQIAEILKRCFGGNPKIKKQPKKNSIVVSFFSRPVAELFVSLMGRGSLNKELSQTILDMPINLLLDFLNAWQEGDGWKTDKEIIFGTSSSKLAKQSWYVLSSLGYKPRFQTVKNNSGFSKNDSYRIRIGRKKEQFNFITKNHTWKRYFWVGIKHIRKEHYKGYVYDLHIEEPHWYLTDCGLVHNSDMHDFDLWPSRAQALVNKPYITNDTISQITEPEQLSSSEMQDRVDALLLTQGVRSNVFHRTFPTVDIDIEQDVDIESALARLM